MAKKWAIPTNDDGTLVNEAETIVKAVRDRFVADVQALTNQVVGKSGRPFMTVELSPEERQARFQEMRELDDPQIWQKQLESVQSDPASLRKLLRHWSEGERAWREAQAQQAAANQPGSMPTTPILPETTL